MISYVFSGFRTQTIIICQLFNCVLAAQAPSPSILGGTIRKHLAAYEGEYEGGKYQEVVKILSDLYVDDLSCSTNNDHEAFEIYSVAKEIVKKGGFNLYKWQSNSKELMKLINDSESETLSDSTNSSKLELENNATFSEDDQSYAKTESGSTTSADETKVLGVNWDPNSDKFYFNFAKVHEYGKELPITKGSVLKLLAKLFDPIGVLSPFIIRLKILFQQICIAKFDWDEELQGEMHSKFLSYLSELPTLNQIPWCYFNSSSQIVSIQLHAFSDASELAYSYIAYLRTEYKPGEIGVRFVTSKFKVAPIKTQSVPRLELMGACLLSEQVDNVYNVLSLELTELPIEKVCWVDSSATLCGIQNEKPWKKFIRDRVKRIGSVTDPQEWRYVPGPLNPADLPTRGLSGKDLLNNKTWLEGLQFLKQHPDSWPETIPTSVTKENEANLEIIKNPKEITFALLTKGSVEKELPHLKTSFKSIVFAAN